MASYYRSLYLMLRLQQMDGMLGIAIAEKNTDTNEDKNDLRLY